MDDCFARDKRIVCTALSVSHCLGKDCKFYKTKEQIEKEEKESKKRLNSRV